MQTHSLGMILHRGKGCWVYFLILSLTAFPAQTVCAEGARLWEFSQSLPGKQQDGGSWALSGGSWGPRQGESGDLGQGPGDTPCSRASPPAHPLSQRAGEGGCSVGSQSRQQCHKAHPLGVSWKRGDNRVGAKKKRIIPKYFFFFSFYGTIECSSSLN